MGVRHNNGHYLRRQDKNNKHFSFHCEDKRKDFHIISAAIQRLSYIIPSKICCKSCGSTYLPSYSLSVENYFFST